jgi:NADH:ubiquinone oxidoreductase subunit 3 (subunit A)
MIMDGKLLLAVADVVVFLGVLGSALAYAWRKGALKWV